MSAVVKNVFFKSTPVSFNASNSFLDTLMNIPIAIYPDISNKNFNKPLFDLIKSQKKW